VTAIESNPKVFPVPDRLTVRGLVLVLSTTVRVPVLVPCVVGANVTEITQLAPAPNVPGDTGQADVSPKSPEVEIPRIVNGTV
jgi:hypothetical protein